MNDRYMIVYFSGTGNTLMLARTLREKLINRGRSAEILNIESLRGKDNMEFDEDLCLIIAFPVYAYGPPKIIMEFIQKLAISSGKREYILFANYGLYAGNAFKIASDKMSEKGYTLRKCLGLRMPANYIVLYNPHTKKKTVEKRLLNAEHKMDHLAESIDKNEVAKVKPAIFPLNIILKYIYKIFIILSDIAGKPFYNTNKCVFCLKCIELCPENNIKLTESKSIKWFSSCQQCMRCIHICPEKAIEWSFITFYRRRYFNPKVKESDLII